MIGRKNSIQYLSSQRSRSPAGLAQLWTVRPRDNMKPKVKWAVFGVVTAWLVVAAAEVFFHWYAGTKDTATAHCWKGWYMASDPQNGKLYHASFVDFIIPVIFLGLVAGFMTARQSKGMMVWSVFLLCLGLVALWPFYANVTPTRDSDEWWRFASTGARAVAFVPPYFKAALLCLFCAGVGRAFGLYFRHITPPYDL